MKNNNRTKFISITLSVALISALGLGGCGSSTEAKKEDVKTSVLNLNEKQGYNAVSGKITLDESSNTKTRILTKKQADITAYNLDDNSIYKTTTDTNGNYELSGLTDGNYQIIAENSRYAKSAAQRVTLKKGSRAIVDFSLTAAGTVSGKITGAGFVYIPGTDHVSVTDSEGNFALTGVPVGTYKLMFEANDSDERGSIDITISAGAVTNIEQDSGFSAESHYDEFGYVDTSLELGVLELHHKGIHFNIYGMPMYDYKDTYYQKSRDYNRYNYSLKKFISLKNSAGEEVAFKIDSYDGLSIKTKDIVPAGTYTLTFSKELSKIINRPMDEDRVYTFSVENISIAMTSMNNGSRIMKIIFPTTLTDTQKSSFGDIKVAEKGVTTSLDLKSAWGNNALLLFGAFKTGVEYEIKPNASQSAILGNLKNVDETLMFGEAEVTNMYPNNGAENTNIYQGLYVNVKYANELDPSTVKFTLNSQEYEGKDIIFNGKNDYYNDDDYRSSRVNISFKHDKLAYGTDYTLTFSAKDMSGNAITKTTTFKTMTPSIVEMEPEKMEDLFDDMQMIRFNVPVNPNSGTLTIENLTDSSKVAEIKRDIHDYSYDPYEIFFGIKKLVPNQRYRVTASGFKDKDGVEINTKTTEFSTPPRMLFVPDQYSQNINVSGENFNHKVNLFFFGGLTDAEKEALENNLLVTSYGQAIGIDATHPVRKLFFVEEEDGVMVSVAFTIDPNTNYELTLSDASGLEDIVLPDNTKLVSFATVRKDNGTNDPDAFKVIERLSVQQPYLQQSYNQTNNDVDMKLVSNIDMNIKLPLGYVKNERDEYGNNMYRSCWDEYRDFADSEVANNLVKESLKVTNGTDEIDVTLNNTNWSIQENWIDNDTRMCYARNNNYQSIASFEVDYNKTYEVSLNFADTLESEIPVSKLAMTQTLKTNPVGTVDFYLTDGMDSSSNISVSKEMRAYEPDMYDNNLIMFHMHANAPMKTENIDNLFSVKVNGSEFEPEYYFDRNDMNITGDISFAIPRTLYSLVQVEFSRVPGQNMTFMNPLTEELVVNNSSLQKPVVLVEDVAPDLLPVKVEKVQTTSIQNNEIVVDFNRPVNPADIATVDDNGAVSNVAFEVKANDGESVNIVGINGTNEGVLLELSKELNASKTYTLSLKDGKSIKAAFGAQELKEFSQEIPLTFIEVGEMLNLYQNGSVENESANPYMLGSTDKVNANFNNNETAVVIPVNLADRAVINIDNSSITAKYAYGDRRILNTGSLEYDAQNSILVQPISSEYDINVNATITYTAQGEEHTIERTQNYLNRVELPYVSWYYGNGENAITFRIDNMQYNYPISPKNFVVYNEAGEKVDANITVQFNNENNQEPTVTFGSLDPDSIYTVEIVGIPSYNISPNMLNGLSIDTIFIATPPAAP